jgi:hypothetical protein
MDTFELPTFYRGVGCNHESMLTMHAFQSYFESQKQHIKDAPVPCPIPTCNFWFEDMSQLTHPTTLSYDLFDPNLGPEFTLSSNDVPPEIPIQKKIKKSGKIVRQQCKQIRKLISQNQQKMLANSTTSEEKLIHQSLASVYCMLLEVIETKFVHLINPSQE